MSRVLPEFDKHFSIQPQFRPLLIEVVKQIQSFLGKKAYSIYLAGSVARGSAVVGRSDVNLTVVTAAPLTAAERALVLNVALRAKQIHPISRNIELTLVELAEVLDIANVFRWGFWFKHCSHRIAGDDLASRFGCFEASWEIAKQLNADLPHCLSSYRRKIMATKVVADYLDYCDFIARKMLWAAFGLVFHRKRQLALSLEDASSVFLEYYPDKSTEIERLFVLISRTQVPKKASLYMLDSFGSWLVAEFDKINRKIG
ncbi:hypothetical protein [Photobacterium aquae]|uniref:hypothetical protein n=1 Tax=Photobacterium aquae TaxID=1195763 RepID=UPI00069F8196|nr:hypothetical protein [Photobacterium aquae]